MFLIINAINSHNILPESLEAWDKLLKNTLEDH